MGRRQYLLISGLIFALVATFHLLRALLGWPLVVASWSIPSWLSWVVGTGAGGLAVWGFRSARTYDRIIRR